MLTFKIETSGFNRFNDKLDSAPNSFDRPKYIM